MCNYNSSVFSVLKKKGENEIEKEILTQWTHYDLTILHNLQVKSFDILLKTLIEHSMWITQFSIKKDASFSKAFI